MLKDVAMEMVQSLKSMADVMLIERPLLTGCLQIES